MVLEATNKERGEKVDPHLRAHDARLPRRRRKGPFCPSLATSQVTIKQEFGIQMEKQGLRQAVLIVLLSGRVSRTIILIYGQPLDPPQLPCSSAKLTLFDRATVICTRECRPDSTLSVGIDNRGYSSVCSAHGHKDTQDEH